MNEIKNEARTVISAVNFTIMLDSFFFLAASSLMQNIVLCVSQRQKSWKERENAKRAKNTRLTFSRCCTKSNDG